MKNKDLPVLASDQLINLDASLPEFWFTEITQRPVSAEFLEPRILFSGSPVPAPDAAPAEEPAQVATSTPAAEAVAEVAQEAAPVISTLPEQTSFVGGIDDIHLAAVAEAAVQRWVDSGLTDEQINTLNTVSYSIADLDGTKLGVASGLSIIIDRDAGGTGSWFIDPTPDQDEEYTTELDALAGTDASGRIDLLTVLIHEQGHMLGLLDRSVNLDGNVMSGIIRSGVRLLPAVGQAVGSIPGPVVGELYASAPIANNDPQTPGDPAYTTNEDTALTVSVANGVLTNDSDPDSDLLIVLNNTNSVSGATVAVNSSGGFTYNPGNVFHSLDQGQVVTDTFTYTVGEATGVAGLLYGTLSGNVNTTSPNPGTSISIDLAEANDTIVAGNTTEIFTGQIFDADGNISFWENYDDKVRLYINGVLVLNNDTWNAATSTGNLNLGAMTGPNSDGWHNFELRVSNGSGSGGSVNTPGFAFQFDPNGGTAWQRIQDTPGLGASILRHLVPVVAPDGLFNIEGIQVIAGGTDTQLNSTTETLGIWNAIEGGAIVPGTISANSNTYNLRYVSGTTGVVIYNGNIDGYTGSQAYSTIGNGSITGGDDLSLKVQTFIRFNSAGTYSISTASDDGRRLELTEAAAGSAPGFTGFTAAGGQLTGSFTPGTPAIFFDGTTGRNHTTGVFTVAAGDILSLESFFFDRGSSDNISVAIKAGSDTTHGGTSDGWTLLRNGAAGVTLSSNLATLQSQLVDTATVTVTVTGINDAPVANNDNATVSEALDGIFAISSVGGNVLSNDTDADDPNSSFSVTTVGTIAGTYGSLLLNSNGTYTYTLDNSNPAVDGLNLGEKLVESFTYTMSDNHSGGNAKSASATLTITIAGVNDTPVATDNTADVTEDSNPVDTGNLIADDDGNGSDSDPEGETLTVIEVSGTSSATDPGIDVVGAYGTLNWEADGSYTYTLDSSNPAVNALSTLSAPLTDVFTYTVADPAPVVTSTGASGFIRGTGTGALLGGDLTDPENNGSDAVPGGANFNAIFTASSEPFFTPGDPGQTEAAFDVFDNKVGAGEAKFCCGNPPHWIAAQLAAPKVLTHFTITSSNDTPGRDPDIWEIQGSNDGSTWESIFVYNNDGVNPFTNRNQVLLYNSSYAPSAITAQTGTTHFESTAAYTHFRYMVTSTVTTGHALSELEFFGVDPFVAYGKTSVATLTVTINGQNDAPVLVGPANNFDGVAVNDSDNDGNLVSELTGTITDVDSDALVGGIAITGSTLSNAAAASWQFSTDGGTSWFDVGSVDPGNGLLLRPTDRVRLSPNGLAQVTGSITYKAWDQTGATAGQEGTKANTVPDGGATPFSTGFQTSNAYTVNVTIENGNVEYGEEAGRNDRLRIFTDGTNLILHDPNGPITTDDGVQVNANTVSIALSLFNDLIIDANDLNDVITLGDMTGFGGSIFINGGAGQDSLTVSANAMVSLGPDEDFTAVVERFTGETGSWVSVTGGGSIDIIATGSTSGAGTFHGAHLRGTLMSEAGDINVAGESGDNGTGVYVNGGTVTTVGGGNIVLTGTGGDAGGNNKGVLLYLASVDSSGTLDITGESTGGAAGSSGNEGVGIIGGSTTAAGDANITGTGAASSAGAGNLNAGVSLDHGANIESTSGAVTIVGQAGNGDSNNVGIVANRNVAINAATDITLTGTGAGDNGGNRGIYLTNGIALGAVSGGISLMGTATQGVATGHYNTGVELLRVSLNAGTSIGINGTGGTGISNNMGAALKTLTANAGSTVSISGTGGNASGNSNSGLLLELNTAINSGGPTTLVGTALGGNSYNTGITISRSNLSSNGISITGTGAGTGGYNKGVSVAQSLINAGTAALSVAGAAAAGSGPWNAGVDIRGTQLVGNSATSLIAGTGGGGMFGPGAFMSAITGNLASSNVFTNPNDDSQKGGDFFSILPFVTIPVTLANRIGKRGEGRATFGGIFPDRHSLQARLDRSLAFVSSVRMVKRGSTLIVTSCGFELEIVDSELLEDFLGCQFEQDGSPLHAVFLSREQCSGETIALSVQVSEDGLLTGEPKYLDCAGNSPEQLLDAIEDGAGPDLCGATCGETWSTDLEGLTPVARIRCNQLHKQLQIQSVVTEM